MRNRESEIIERVKRGLNDKGLMKYMDEEEPEQVEPETIVAEVTKSLIEEEVKRELNDGNPMKYMDEEEPEQVELETIVAEVTKSLIEEEVDQELNDGNPMKYMDEEEPEQVELETIIAEVREELKISEEGRTVCASESDSSAYKRAIDLINEHKLRNFGFGGISDVVWAYNGRIYHPLAQKDLEQLVYDSLSEMEKHMLQNCQRFLKQVATYIQRELASEASREKYCFEEEDFSAVRNRIVFQNGVYDVLSGELYPFSDNLPYYLEVNAVFKADEEVKPVYYEKLKVYATGMDEESMKMFDIITAVMFLNCRPKYIYVAGSASNSGKSKYIEFLERLMPSGRVSRLAPSDLKSKFALGEADKVTLFSCADIEMEVIPPAVASLLKRLTGDTFVRGEAKFHQARDIRILGKIILGTNGRFCTKRSDRGMFNRLIVLPFVNEVREKDRDEMLLDKMWQERSDIMTMCVLKLHDLMTREGKLVIPVSEQSEKIKETWLSCKDLVKEFMEAKVEITGNKDDNFSEKELYGLYTKFYAENAAKYSGECCRLSMSEFKNELFKLSDGLIIKTRVCKINGERVKHAVWRICGLKICDKNRFFIHPYIPPQ